MISLQKADEALIEIKQHFLAFELESNKERFKIIGFSVENEGGGFVYNYFTNSYIHSSSSIQ